MKICEHCGFHNWTLVFVKVVGNFQGSKAILCDDCGRRIDDQAAQCDPLIGHSERTEAGGSDLWNGSSTFVGILPSGGGEKNG